MSKAMNLEPKISKEVIVERVKTAKSLRYEKRSVSPKSVKSEEKEQLFEPIEPPKRHYQNPLMKKTPAINLTESVDLNTKKINYLNNMLREIGTKIEIEKANEEINENPSENKTIFNHLDVIYKNYHNLPSILPRITKRFDNPDADLLVLNRPSYKTSYKQSGSYQPVSLSLNLNITTLKSSLTFKLKKAQVF